MTAGHHRAKHKEMAWTGLFEWPDGRQVRLGNVTTKGYDPQYAKQLLVELAASTLAPGHELGWWGRGRLEYIDEGDTK